MATNSSVVTTSAPAAEPVVMLLGASALLGTLGVFATEAGQAPLITVWARCLFGGLALGAYAIARGQTAVLRLGGTTLRLALLSGVLLVTSWTLFFTSLKHTSIAVSTVAFHVQPLWVLGVAALRRERVTKWHLGAALLALVGVGLLSGLTADAAEGSLLGVGLALAASLAYAAVTTIAKVIRTTSLGIAWWQCMVGVAILSWWPAVHGLPPVGPSWGWLAGLGVIHTGLVYVMTFSAVQRLPMGRVAMLQFAYPLFAVLTDSLVYGHALSVGQLLGGAILITAQLMPKENRP